MVELIREACRTVEICGKRGSDTLLGIASRSDDNSDDSDVSSDIIW